MNLKMCSINGIFLSSIFVQENVEGEGEGEDEE